MLFRLLASVWRAMSWLRDQGDVAGGLNLADGDRDVLRTRLAQL